MSDVEGETNGYKTRIDQLEKFFDMLAADHEAFRAEQKRLLIAQVLQEDAIRENSKQIAELRKHGKAVDDRIAKLGDRVDSVVSAIGELVHAMGEKRR